VGPDSLVDPSSLPAIAAARALGADGPPPAVGLPREHAAGDAPAVGYNAATTIFDSTRHRLHGMLHANGFGHLLRVNGREGGSRSATGLQLSALWDVVCQGLRARRVSTEDVSNRAGMELRVVHTAATGQTWYGQFGYQFGRGVYNTKEHAWRAAAGHVAAAPLAHLLHDFLGVEAGVEAVVRRYRLGVRPGVVEVLTLGGLLHRLLYLLGRPDEAGVFFEERLLARAQVAWDARERAEAEKRAAQRVAPARRPSAAPGVSHKKKVPAAGAAAAAAPAPPPKITLKLRAPGAASAQLPPGSQSGKKRRDGEQAGTSGGAAAPAPKRAKRAPPTVFPPGQEALGWRIRVYIKDRRTRYSGLVRGFNPASG
jgi:hypothetical protein